MDEYLKILGLGEKSFNYKLIKDNGGSIKLESRSEYEKDKIIKEAYDNIYTQINNEYNEELKVLENEFTISNNASEIKYNKIINFEVKNKSRYEIRKKAIITKYSEKTKKIIKAYNSMRTFAMREITAFNSFRSKIKENRKLRYPTTYKGLGFSEEYINSLPKERANEIIKEKYLKIMQAFESALSDNSLLSEEREKIKLLQNSCKESYKYISNVDMRKKYTEFLDNMELKEKYSKFSQYNPQLIYSDDTGGYRILKKDSKNSVEIHLNDNLIIKKVASLSYINATGTLNSYINQYEIKRKSYDEEKIDYIYSDINLQQLETDEKTGKLINPQYYHCVVNELLSEEMIKASKFNSGYIGLVESVNNVDGEERYCTTLQNKKLSQTEQEYLTVVTIYENKQQNNNEVKDGDNYYIEGEER